MEQFERFTRAERLLHWSSAVSIFLLGATGWFLWRREDEWEINGINVLSQTHVWVAGLMLVLGAAGFLLWRRRSIPFSGKRFSRGQAVALRFVQALLAFMTLSGSILYLREFVEMSKPLRTFLRQAHIIGAGGVLAFVALHLAMVILIPRNRGLLKGMITGRVRRDVASRASPAWAAALETEAQPKHPLKQRRAT